MHQSQVPVLPVYTPAQLQREFSASSFAIDFDVIERDTPEWTRFGGQRLPGVDVFRFEGRDTCCGRRVSRHIRQDGVDDFLVSMPRSALITLSQSHAQSQSEVCVEPGCIALVSTLQPTGFQIAPDCRSDPFSMLHIRVSGAMLRQRLPQIDACCHRPIRLQPGAGKIMQSLFDLALSEASMLSLTQARHFSQMLIDALANVVSAAPELACVNDPTPSAHAIIRGAAQSFIERNLSSPELSVADVARHCRVSVRYLHKAFASASQTIGDYIRRSRLLQCRAALQAPALSGRSVTTIAMMWGFNDASSFCRAYKAEFGVAPSKDRQTSAG